MLLSFEKFKKMIPTNREPDQWYNIAVEMLGKYEINTVNRIAGFFAQTAHESSDFRVLEENMNYSAERLREVFPRYFKTNAAAYAAAYKPVVIANVVYMDKNRTRRGALGNVQEGDGWKFRGGGIKQLTGRNNYERFGKSIDMSADEAAHYVRTKKGAFESACWFWKENKLERYADKDDIVGMSKKVNGGSIGLADRKERYSIAKMVLGGALQESSESKKIINTLRRGMVGDDVKLLQKALGVYVDGKFGFGTASALKKWQRVNKLTVDGIAGENTLRKLGLI